MECRFISHGLSIAYDHVAKPCCVWKQDQDWVKQNQIQKIDIVNWHKSRPIQTFRTQLENNIWPEPCSFCQQIEDMDRDDSMRGNGNHAYADYQEGDITLEIRPGNTCNFACQTCWPEASSRVAQYHHKAKIIDIQTVNSKSFDNFDFLNPVTNRIKDVVVLGGEPFYDKNCLSFLDWSQKNLSANVVVFTNGSAIKWDWIQNYKGRITLVFSLDAIGRPAEYIRFGGVWDEVVKNYNLVKNLQHVDVRVNITTSIYNYIYIEQLVDFLLQDWPSVVTISPTYTTFYRESTVPMPYRKSIIDSLTTSIDKIQRSDVHHDQKSNAVNALQSIITNLENQIFDQVLFDKLKKFVCDMDQVKNVNIKDYCPEVAEYFSYNSHDFFDH